MTKGLGVARQLVAGTLIVLGVQSCSSSEGDAGISPACRTQCSELCSSFEGCGITSSSGSCVDDCNAALRSADCTGALPPSQLTCDELAQVARCAEHCTALCARAPECGDFDQQLCVEGCASTQPVVCNAASVPARTCDQLKPEARWYEQLGRDLHDDNGATGGFFSPASFGLCESTSDCDEPLVCALATNTCGNCSADAECDRGFGQVYKCQSGACVEVECAADSDCSLSLLKPTCDLGSFQCVGCLTSADCTASTLGSIYPFCNPATLDCVECLTTTDCQPPYTSCSPTGDCML